MMDTVIILTAVAVCVLAFGVLTGGALIDAAKQWSKGEWRWRR